MAGSTLDRADDGSTVSKSAEIAGLGGAPDDAALTSRIEAPAEGGRDIWSLPRGQHKLAPEEIRASQQARLFYALVHCVAEKGYSATTLTDLCGRAKVSRTTFYQHFKNKEACYLAAYEHAHNEVVAVVTQAQDRNSGWSQRLQDSLTAYLRYNRDNPAVARALLVEIHAVGPEAWAKRDWGHERFSQLQRNLYEIRRREQPALPELPDVVFLGAIAAVEEMVCSYVRKGQAERMMDLRPAAGFLLEAVYSGNVEAARLLIQR